MTSLLGPPPNIKQATAVPKALEDAFEQLFTLRRAGAAEILLVRHGQPDYDAALDGFSAADAPLTAEGRAQAMQLAAYLEEERLDAVYSSTARHAVETAAYIAAAQGMPVVQTADLCDSSYEPDALDNVLDQGPTLAGDLAERFLQMPRWDALPGFERSKAFRHRVIQAVEAIVGRHPGQRVAIISHNGVINAYLSMLLGIQRDVFFLPAYASISIVPSSGDLYGVTQLNDVSHLTGAVQSF